MIIPSIDKILLDVRLKYSPVVAESLYKLIRGGLMWAPESYPTHNPSVQLVIGKWYGESDLEHKADLKGGK